MNGSAVRIDGLVCNDFSPQARLAAELAKKLKAKPKIESVPDVVAKKQTKTETARLKQDGHITASTWDNLKKAAQSPDYKSKNAAIGAALKARSPAPPVESLPKGRKLHMSTMK